MNSPVRTTWIDIAPGYAGWLALPPAGQGPGLVLFQEIFGVNEHIRMLAEQYALDGFTVLAPDVFWRQAPRVDLGYEGADRERARTLMSAYTADDALSDVAAGVQALRVRPEVSGRVGALGYCMGGRLAGWRRPRRGWTPPWRTTAAASRTNSTAHPPSAVRCSCTTPNTTNTSRPTRSIVCGGPPPAWRRNCTSTPAPITASIAGPARPTTRRVPRSRMAAHSPSWRGT